MKKIFKTLYSLVPFKKQIFFLLKKNWSPSQNIYKHLYFKGKFRLHIDPTTSFQIVHYGFEIENELFWKGIKGGWEKVSLSLWMKLCRSSSVILDIGANTGIYSLVAKTLNPAAKIFAFEPVERVFNKLVKNCQLNNYNITCYKKAVSNYTGEAVIYDTDTSHIYSVTVNKNLNASSTPVIESKIETVTLKEFIENNSITQIDLIKIDVETHEPEVLEGFGEYLNKFQPAMLIEVLNDEVARQISLLINKIDYLYFNIDENKGIRRVDKLEKSDYYNYFICSKKVALELNLLDL